MTMQENMHNGHLQGMYAFKTFFNKPLQPQAQTHISSHHSHIRPYSHHLQLN